ncbi:mannose-1-phosphate guanylyltransferase/mannose-6-phosphate isomerase [Inquilinus sp. 2KB_23]|uniref:mannose-1-phosphate guanylyltransferase/mannose-6-phosphate isomerase n=1 Tax=Inquilinus sp. 2KB_23 TaxID=3232979 RepID=UPI003F93A0F0
MIRNDRPVVPVVLSGGSGTRLWPLSRAGYPKQFLPLVSDGTMIQETVARVGEADGFAPPVFICADDHRFVVAEQMRQIGVAPSAIILEPVARNTAPAVAVAARFLADQDPDTLMLVLPADHHIADPAGFRAAIAAAAPAARAGYLMTFGMQPTAPETGYGYILPGEAIEGAPGARAVSRFVEKPPRETAEQFLAEGRHLWNAGIFLFTAGRYLAEVGRHAPQVLAAADAALKAAARDLTFLRLDAAAFVQAPSISIDHAVMEKTERAGIVPAAIGWTDVGSWSSLWEIGDRDADGNLTQGDALALGSRNCLIRSDGILTAVIGLEDTIVIATDDAVLVAAKDQVQDVKAITDRLKAAKRPEAVIHREIYRPWGTVKSLHAGDRFQVKRVIVHPGQELALQRHYHRSEHWVVLSGTARVTLEGQTRILRENEAIYLPIGTDHRLENPGKIDLELIEVRAGPYLGEDDVVRLEQADAFSLA